jgi:hypothetical protein
MGEVGLREDAVGGELPRCDGAVGACVRLPPAPRLTLALLTPLALALLTRLALALLTRLALAMLALPLPAVALFLSVVASFLSELTSLLSALAPFPPEPSKILTKRHAQLLPVHRFEHRQEDGERAHGEYHYDDDDRTAQVGGRFDREQGDPGHLAVFGRPRGRVERSDITRLTDPRTSEQRVTGDPACRESGRGLTNSVECLVKIPDKTLHVRPHHAGSSRMTRPQAVSCGPLSTGWSALVP